MFTTAAESPGDTEPPEVISVTPEDGEIEVSPDAEISAVFSESVHESSLVFSVTDSSGNSIAGAVSYDDESMTAIFTPEIALNYGMIYTAVIGSQLTDLGGNTMSADHSWQFTTAAETPGDTEPPEVISVTPEDGEIEVSPDAEISAVFSESVDESSLVFFISDSSGNRVSGAVSYDDEKKTAIFTPETALSYGMTYTAAIGAQLSDLAGNTMSADHSWQFTTAAEAPGDTEPPEVISVTPEHGETGVSSDAEISAVFSESVDESSLVFFISDSSGDKVSGAVSYYDEKKTAIFTPENALNYGMTHTAAIATQLSDLAGNTMSADYSWTFTTESEPDEPADTEPPFVRTTIPADNDDGVALNAAISATFSEVMNASSIHQNTFFVTDENGSVPGTIKYSGMTATFMPQTLLTPGTTYIVTISAQVTDLAGNTLETDDSWSFTAAGTDFNNPSDTPSAVYPEDNALVSAGTVRLQASEFSDPEGDIHVESRWRIKRADCDDCDEPQEYSATSGDLTAYSLYGLYPGVRYTWKVGYTDAGNGNISWSEAYFFTTGVSEMTTGMRIEPGVTISDYRMMSFFVYPNNPSCGGLFENEAGGKYDRKNFRIGTYSPETGEYIECGVNLVIQPGRSYWFLARNGLNITTTGVPVSIYHDIDVALRYNPAGGNGWNMIAAPNNADYFWEDVQVIAYNNAGNIIFGPTAVADLPDGNPYIDTRLWRWENGIYASDTFLIEKTKGYWVKAIAGNVSLRFPMRAQTAAIAGNRRSDHLYKMGEHWVKSLISKLNFTRQAIADDGDSPPMPMSSLNTGVSEKSDGGGGGCFISTVSGN
jgi:methionine-rich copper-binding protein CopC